MKRIFLTLLAAMVLMAGDAYGQVCNYDPDAVESAPGRGTIWPPEILPSYKCAGLYNQNISVVVPVDTDILPLVTCTVVDITADAILGLPAGYTYACNPGSCVFPGGALACVSVVGDPAGAAVGDYPLSLVTTNTLDCGILGIIVTSDTTDNASLGYTLKVADCGDCSSLDAPANPQTLVRETSQQIQLDWGPVSGAIGYRISGGPIPALGNLSPQLGELNNTRSINWVQLASGATYRWGVAAGCGSSGPPLTPLSEFDTFASPTLRIGQMTEELAATMKLTAYPNPAVDFVVLQIESEQESQSTFRIYDVSGRVVMEAMPQVFEGMNVVKYDLDLQAGTYIAELTQGDQRESVTLTVAD